MAKPNLSYQVYLWLDFLPILMLLILVTFLIISYYICQLCCRRHHVGIMTTVANFSTKLAMALFGPPLGVVRRERHQDDEVDHMDVPVIYIHRRQVPWVVSILLGGYVVSFIYFAISVFWEVFLLKQSNSCDDTTIDCFVNEEIDVSNDTLLSVAAPTLLGEKI